MFSMIVGIVTFRMDIAALSHNSSFICNCLNVVIFCDFL